MRVTNKRAIVRIALFIGATSANPLMAQSQMTCGNALQQLQAYVYQVNQMAAVEYNQGIPYRCGYNAYCAQAAYQQLNYWYAQQTQLVNGWYQNIVYTCTTKQSAPRIKTAPPTEDDPGGIDTSSVDDLEVDDEDKTVKIRIPKSPKGFK